jgi:hypothetical protein
VSHADAAASIASRPVVSVGSSTGANLGEWLLGISFTVPFASAFA